MLRSLLKERKITLTELSKETGVSLKALSAFQSQRTDGVQYNTIEKISKALNLEIGEIIKRIDNIFKLDLSVNNEINLDEHGSQKDLEATFSLENIDGDIYSTTLKFDIKFEELNQTEHLYLHIKKLDRYGLPHDVNNYISHAIGNADKDGFFYVISHLIILKVMLHEPFINMDILDFIRVSWDKSMIPAFLINKVNADTINSENDRILFTNREHKINLVPLNPNTILEPHDPDCSIPYTVNIEALSDLSIVFKVDIDKENFERTIYITFD